MESYELAFLLIAAVGLIMQLLVTVVVVTWAVGKMRAATVLVNEKYENMSDNYEHMIQSIDRLSASIDKLRDGFSVEITQVRERLAAIEAGE